MAWILKYTVKEFARSSLDEIQQCIEGTPEIGTTAVDTGLTNVDCITGMNTEDGVSNEGKVTYDIKFYVLLPNKEHTKIIINIEAQKDSSPGYDLVTRAVFYCARMLSSQLNKEFTNHRNDKVKYDGIKKVYSIWVCMDSTKNTKNSIVEFSMQQNNLFGEIKKRIPI